jgi:hypothetical protein
LAACVELTDCTVFVYFMRCIEAAGSLFCRSSQGRLCKCWGSHQYSTPVCYVGVCRHFPSYTAVNIPEDRRKSNFVQVVIEYTYNQLYTYIRGSPFANQTPSHWNLIGRNLIAPPLVLSPSNLVFFRHFRLIAPAFKQGKIVPSFQKYYLAITFFLLFYKIACEIA